VFLVQQLRLLTLGLTLAMQWHHLLQMSQALGKSLVTYDLRAEWKGLRALALMEAFLSPSPESLQDLQNGSGQLAL